MQCRNYRFQYAIREENNVTNVVQVEILSTSAPNTLTPKASDIEGFPKQWADETIKWGAGSIMYVVSTGDVYMADETGTFVLQPANGGGTPSTDINAILLEKD